MFKGIIQLKCIINRHRSRASTSAAKLNSSAASHLHCKMQVVPGKKNAFSSGILRICFKEMKSGSAQAIFLKLTIKALSANPRFRFDSNF